MFKSPLALKIRVGDSCPSGGGTILFEGVFGLWTWREGWGVVVIKTFKGKHTHTFSSLTHQLHQPGEFYESCAIQNYQGNIDLEIFINYYLVNKTVLFST